jgi:hypothetical protein
METFSPRLDHRGRSSKEMMLNLASFMPLEYATSEFAVSNGAIIYIDIEILDARLREFIDSLQREKYKLPCDTSAIEALKNALGRQSDIEKSIASMHELKLGRDEFLSEIVAPLMFDLEFEQIYCDQCDQFVAPGDIFVFKWGIGTGLAAHGGRRLACPKMHTVYCCMEWLS